jgi:hypothetical protein
MVGFALRDPPTLQDFHYRSSRETRSGALDIVLDSRLRGNGVRGALMHKEILKAYLLVLSPLVGESQSEGANYLSPSSRPSPIRGRRG